MKIGERVRQARKEKRMSQGELAAKVGIKQPTLSELENGDSGSSSYLPSIASILGVSALWLQTGKGQRESNAEQKDDAVELLKISELVALYVQATDSGRELILSTANNVGKRESISRRIGTMGES